MIRPRALWAMGLMAGMTVLAVTVESYAHATVCAVAFFFIGIVEIVVAIRDRP